MTPSAAPRLWRSPITSRAGLGSLARIRVVVTGTASGTVNLETLICDELLSVGVSDGPTRTIEGPDVALPGKTAESIGLAIHELTIDVEIWRDKSGGREPAHRLVH